MFKTILMVLALTVLVFGFDEFSYIQSQHPGKLFFTNNPNIGDSRETVVNLLGNPDTRMNLRDGGVAWGYGAEEVGGGGNGEDEYWNGMTQVNFENDRVEGVRITSFYIMNNPPKSDRLDLHKVKTIIPKWAKKKHLFMAPFKDDDIQRILFLAAKNGVLGISCQAQSVDYVNSDPPAVRLIQDPLNWRVFSINFRAYDEKNREALSNSTRLDLVR